MLCKEQGISMNKLEEDLGFGKGYISKLGKSKPNISYIQRIADKFGKSVDYILTGKELDTNKYSVGNAKLDARMSKDPQLKRIYSYYVALNAAQKDMIEQMIRGLANEQNKKE